MSRNVRRKPSTTVKTSRRRGSDTSSSSSLNLSDDDGYSAVEDVSDSEDNDEEDVNAVEEENIMTETFGQSVVSPRPLLFVEEEEEDADEEDGDENGEEDDDHIDNDGSDGASWAGIPDDDEIDFLPFEDDSAYNSFERHVRFDVPSSSSDSNATETDDDHGDIFPDLFVSANSLDPSFRREIEHDRSDSSESATFWDNYGPYHEHDALDTEDAIAPPSDDDTPVATPALASFPAAFDPTCEPQELEELDGYETDGEGDTTEEDVPDPPMRRKMRRTPSVFNGDDSDSEVDVPLKRQRGQPRIGRFDLDKSNKKPIAVLNPLTRKMMIFTPMHERPLDLSPEQFNLPWHMPADSSPIFSNSANLMFSAMFSSNGLGDLTNNTQTMGPAEAFFPWTRPETSMDDSSCTPSGDDAGEDEAEEGLDLSHFITFGDSDDNESSGDDESKWRESSTPARPTTASSDVSHIKSDTVGAFRRNQIDRKLILSNQATQDSLAFSGPYNYTALKGIRSDRFDTAAVPLTPVRRQKRHMMDFTRSPLEAASTKRKASAEVASQGHKKQRSISDVTSLAI
ncbi:hypothetical protein S40288_05881 [Stachybotrys chartarum IBT 40288]|nr:hypothetical protein S40288_05881 [Stachybotrys chartarum IBT 40288]